MICWGLIRPHLAHIWTFLLFNEVLYENAKTNRLGSSPEALRGLKEGSGVLVAASIISQRGGSTGSATP